MSFVPRSVVVEAGGGAHSRVALVLHGIFGSVRNWKGFLTQWMQAAPDWRAVAVDLRHHGESRGAPPPNTLEECANDLARLVQELGIRPDAVMAHSFGGKVALEWARLGTCPARSLWILDSPPGAGPGGNEPPDSVVGLVLSVMKRLRPVAKRSEAVQEFVTAGVPAAVATWMASSLRLGADGYRFDFDLDALSELLADYWRRDLYEVMEKRPAGMEVHAVVGERSLRFASVDRQRHEALAADGRIHLHVLPASGHWLHVDNPSGLIELFARA